MAEAIAKFLLAYLLGNLMGGALVGRLRGSGDLRLQGSGNLGATNALRTQGKGFALAVLVIDVLKGVIAARVIPLLHWPLGGAALPGAWLATVCGIGVVLGHCYPAVLGFRGGKGVATLAGVFGALLPMALLWMLPVFVLVVMLSGYVSAATLAAAATALCYVSLADGAPLHSDAAWFTLAMALLVAFKHRDNIRRLLQGGEHRFEKARVLGRWLDQRP